MICLAMDTAGTACSACLYDSERDVVLGEISEEIGKGHAERLMDIITNVMALAHISYKDIDRIVTATGPGSFTGIRVGVATARGFGVGLNIPVVGVSNLEAILHEFSADIGDNRAKSGALGVAMTAGRGQAYCLFEFETKFAQAHEPFVTDIEALKTELGAISSPFLLCGSAAAQILDREQDENSLEKKPYLRASISTVARLGAASTETAKKPEPLYLRKPDAVPQKGFAVERAK